MKEWRPEIKAIEAEIFAITGKNNEIYNHWADDEEKRNRVIKLLNDRHSIIEDLFFPVKHVEVERLKAFNKKLKNLTKSTRKKLEKVVMKTLNERQRGEEFVVEGSLSQVYKGDDSVLKFDEDRLYCSNFTLIIKVLTELSIALHKEKILDIKIDSKHFPFDDKENYRETLTQIIEAVYAPLRESKYYMVAEICAAAQDFVTHKLFTGAELLRLNDFKQEITVTHQFSHQQYSDPDLRT